MGFIASFFTRNSNYFKEKDIEKIWIPFSKNFGYTKTILAFSYPFHYSFKSGLCVASKGL